MQTFLNQPEATFYHVTTVERWDKIRADGLEVRDRRIFVSRVGELPVLLAIAYEQLPEIYNSRGIVFLKLPQRKNNFIPNEIAVDRQSNEWTSQFQNIILRYRIPIENIELMMIFNLGEPKTSGRVSMDLFLTRIFTDGREYYMNHYITNRAQEIVYNER